MERQSSYLEVCMIQSKLISFRALSTALWCMVAAPLRRFTSLSPTEMQVLAQRLLHSVKTSQQSLQPTAPVTSFTPVHSLHLLHLGFQQTWLLPSTWNAVIAYSSTLRPLTGTLLSPSHPSSSSVSFTSFNSEPALVRVTWLPSERVCGDLKGVCIEKCENHSIREYASKNVKITALLIVSRTLPRNLFYWFISFCWFLSTACKFSSQSPLVKSEQGLGLTRKGDVFIWGDVAVTSKDGSPTRWRL